MIEKEVIPVLSELGIGLVAFAPAGRGGDLNQFSDMKRLKSAAIEKIVEKKGVSAVQLSLAWVEAQQNRLGGAGLVPIPQVTNEKNLTNNVDATNISLSKEDLVEIEKAIHWHWQERTSPSWTMDRNPPLTKEISFKYGLPKSVVADP
jgi:aryl-alcohol dehydrogenase-like predicted oxidoreductase